jgi:hypothetical protein
MEMSPLLFGQSLNFDPRLMWWKQVHYLDWTEPIWQNRLVTGNLTVSICVALTGVVAILLLQALFNQKHHKSEP